MKRVVSLMAALALVGLAGCTGPTAAGNTATTTTITVLAASSLTESFTTLGTKFEAAHPGTKVVFSFGASSTLAAQITQGAPADVFASASAKNADDVVKAGAAEKATVFARNYLAIAVPASNPAKVDSLDDLAQANVKVALCQAAVPCGVLADTILTRAKLTVTPVTREADVKAVLTKVTLGEVDAGLVYVTDVKAAGATVAKVAIPDAVNAATDYPIATLTTSTSKVTAQAFTDFVLSTDGAAVLAEAGFAKP